MAKRRDDLTDDYFPEGVNVLITALGVDRSCRNQVLEAYESKLYERENKILDLYFGIRDGFTKYEEDDGSIERLGPPRQTMTQQEIGELLGLTNQRVSQIKNKALEKIKSNLEARVG